MAAQYAAVDVHEVPRLPHRGAEAPQEGHIVPVGHKADVLTVRAVGAIQSRRRRHGPDLSLPVVPQGQQQAAEHLLGDVPGAAPPLRAVDRADLHDWSLQA